MRYLYTTFLITLTKKFAKLQIQKAYLLFCCMFFFTIAQNNVAAQISVDWSKNFGSLYIDFPQSIIPTQDGGYFLAGYNEPFPFGQGRSDGWFVKMDEDGNTQWERNLGGSELDFIHHAIQTSDGGYLCFGDTESRNGDVTSSYNGSDFWLVKLDANGNEQWNRTYGGNGAELGKEVIETDDGGFIAVGYSSFSFSGDVGQVIGEQDFWIIKVDDQGNLIWKKTYGGTLEDQAWSIQRGNDSGYIIAGMSESVDNDVSTNQGSYDAWIIKIDDNGNLIWEKSYGGNNRDEAHVIKAVSDGYVVGGYSYSSDGDLSVNKGTSDFWAFKIDNEGALIHSKTYGGVSYDFGQGMTIDNQGNIFFIGNTTFESLFPPESSQVSNYRGGDYDAWLLKLNPTLDLIWERTIGGSQLDRAFKISTTPDGGTIASIYSNSSDGDTERNNGDYDGLIIKFAPDFTTLAPTCPSITDVSSNIETLIESGDLIQVSATGQQLPINASIDWYYDENRSFNPSNGQGTLLFNSKISEESCLKIEGIMIDACRGTSSEFDTSNGEGANEFLVVSNTESYDLLFTVIQTPSPFISQDERGDDHIVIIGGPATPFDLSCLFKRPDQSIIDQIQSSSSCNVNFIASEADVIPANSLFVILSKNYSVVNYDFSVLCGAGKPIYVAQNECLGSFDAFPNNNAPSTNSVKIISGGCSSQITYSYDRGNSEAETTFVASCAEGNQFSFSDCQPDFNVLLSEECDYNSFILPENFPNGTFYIKGILRPSIDGCNSSVTQAIEFTVNNPIDETATCRYQDSLVLVDLYNATDGENWTNQWDLNTPITTWYGVTTNNEGCVIESRLDKNNLVGELPDLDLPSLTYLDLDGNQLSGRIPNFSKLPNLNYLDLDRNLFSGTIPNFDALPNLEHLDIDLNELTGTIPNFNNMPLLDYLDCSSNNLVGSIPDFDQLPQLEYFDCGGNNLTGTIPDFGFIPILQRLLCENNQLSGNIPDFSSLPLLTELTCSNNELTGAMPDLSDNCPDLRRIYVNNNQLSGCFPEPLITFCSLPFSEDFSVNGYNFTNNPALPWQGDFQRFCNGEDQFGAPCDDGDANTENDVITADCECIGMPVVDENSCRFQDSLALVELYNSMGGTGWSYDDNTYDDFIELDRPVPNAGSNWNVETPIDTWHGVELNSDGCVTRLILNSNRLSGRLPDINLPQLTILELSNNAISFLPDFTNLPELVYLDIDFNQLEGTIPNFSNIPELLYFYCNHNQLTGTIPDFSNLPNLVDFRCDHNDIFGSIPNFSNLTTLEYFECDNNQLAGTIPDFSNLPNLIELECDSNRIEGVLPDLSDNCPNLRQIYFQNNRLSGCFPEGMIAFCGLDFSEDATRNGYNFTNNPALPWQGDFQRFCNNENQIGAPCDDGDPNTENDVITANCGCRGTMINSCRMQDSLVLVELWNATGGENWTYRGTTFFNGTTEEPIPNAGNSWRFDQPINTWHGIQLNMDGCVQWAVLNSNGLVGAIPSELGNLSNLERLDLDFNELSGSIPPELGNLLDLIDLDLGFNDLSGSIPLELGNLSNLERLYLSSNDLSGSIPPELGNLSNLEVLLLSFNALSGSIPPELGNLSNLQRLVLPFNALSGSIPPELGNLSNLQRLVLSVNALSGSIPPELGNLLNLQRLNLRLNALGGGIPLELGNLLNLQELELAVNELSGSIPPELGNLSNLELLSLYDNQLSGSIPPELGNLSNLELLYLDGNQLSGSVPDLSDSSPLLSDLEVDKNKFTFSNIINSIDSNLAVTARNKEFSSQSYTYAPQDTIYSDTTITKAVGEALTINLGIDEGVGSNRYQWYKESLPFRDTIIGDNRLTFASLTESDAGVYTVEVRNPNAPALTLVSFPITIVVEEGSCTTKTASLNTTICQGESYQLGNQTLTAAGTYTETLQTELGCDSVITLTLAVQEVNSPDIGFRQEFCAGTNLPTLRISVGTGETADWYDAPSGGNRVQAGSITFRPNQVGNYYVEIRDVATGCVSAERALIELVELPSYEQTVTEYVCSEAETGEEVLNLLTVGFCDSIVTIQRVYEPTPPTVLTETVCSPEQVGSDTVYLQNQFGCDSLVITNRVLGGGNFEVIRDVRFSCFRSEVGFDTMMVDDSGVCKMLITTVSEYPKAPPTVITTTVCNLNEVGRDTLYLSDQNGCDSLLIFNNNYAAPAETVEVVYNCDSSNDRLDTLFLQTVAGCDSIVIRKEIAAQDSPVTERTATTCIASAAGVQEVLLQNQFGCDSLVRTTTIYEGSERIDSVSFCDPSLFGQRDTLQFINQAGCDSLVITFYYIPLPNYNPSFFQVFTCDIDEAGTFDTLTLQNEFGCDSLIITQFELDDLPIVERTITTCDPDLTGTETFVFERDGACDSTVIISYINNAVPITYEYFETCDPNQAATDTTFLTAQFGCDSLIVRVYEQLEQSAPTIVNASTCQRIFAENDTMQFVNQAGCDSLVVTVFEYTPARTDISAEICANAVYDFHGTILTTPGSYTDTLRTTLGCDSIVRLELQQGQDIVVDTEVQLCEDEFYEFAGQFISVPGSYFHIFETESGCDSTVNLIVETAMVDEVIARNDTIVFLANDQAVKFNVLENDALPSAWELTILSDPTLGAIDVDGKEITYRIDPSFNQPAGEDSIRYQVCLTDCFNYCDTASALIRITFTCKDSLIANIPNAFNPNSPLPEDQVFDPFKDVSNDCFEQPANARLRIYNIHGELVYFTRNQYQPWDGRNSNNKPLPTGTYYYLLEFDLNGEQTKPIISYITLFSEN